MQTPELTQCLPFGEEINTQIVVLNCIKFGFSGSTYLQLNKTFWGLEERKVWRWGLGGGGGRIVTKTKEIKALLIVFKDVSENLLINLHCLFSYDKT